MKSAVHWSSQVVDVDACLNFGMPFTLTHEEDAAANLSQLEENRHLLTALVQVRPWESLASFPVNVIQKLFQLKPA